MQKTNGQSKAQENTYGSLLHNSSAFYIPPMIIHPPPTQDIPPHMQPQQKLTQETRMAVSNCIQRFDKMMKTQVQKEQQLRKLEQILAKYSSACYQSTMEGKSSQERSNGHKQAEDQSQKPTAQKTIKNEDFSQSQSVLTALVIGVLIVPMLFALLLL